ncbi:polysaccharide biosynthesis/export family protein [Afifella pfennigii]|uniref:polysaccharide biosynthesis/export family protein n=1 Tax=Afifella pfennigii TaxID=209897 RepID=UPI00055445DF|nr:polysaccharide biosynthesis/export family protein [Afifella pfennigii]
MNFLRLLVIVVLVSLLASCKERPPLATGTPTIEGPYRLDSGDQLRIVVFGQNELTNIYTVDQAGYIALPLIGEIATRGATSAELESSIEAALASRFVRNPDVTVEVAAYRPFFILGEVSSPGQYPYVPGMTVENAVAVAGGFTPRANERVVRLSRQLNGVLYEGRLAVTEPIRAGDTVYVSERLF